MISIIIPTYNRHESLIKTLVSIENQDYKAKEIIVVDDNSDDNGKTRMAINECKKRFKTNILYLNTYKQGNEWGLARARNMGICEAMGDILMFLDDRLSLGDGVLKKISETINDQYWFYGLKKAHGIPSGKDSFVENFSWITKKNFMRFGCFNERMNIYGGMSDEIRRRWTSIGGMFSRVDVYASENVKSSGKNRRDQIWKAKFLLYKLSG